MKWLAIPLLILVIDINTSASLADPNEPSQQAGAPSDELVGRIRRTENGSPSPQSGDSELPLQMTVEEIMQHFKVPGLSIAVIDDFKIIWAKGYGVTEAGGKNPVTAHTLFQAGSVSKPVAAVGALALVERGQLSLDEDVNTKLKSWKLPDNEFTKDQKVTLRRILSHTAGLPVHFFPGYAVGDPIPTLPQILNGEKPAKTAPVRVNMVPGTKWRYSGGATLIEQQLMLDTMGKPFPELMRELVFDKLTMNDSTYEQPLPAARAGAAASGTYRNGRVVGGKWHVYPEMAAGGLWTTPTDLAALAIEIALSKQGKSNRLLSQAMTREMLKPQIERTRELALGNDQHPDAMGLGFFLGDKTRPDLFGHIGDDAGFEAMLMMFADSGRGVAIMSNSENGILVGDYLTEKIAKEFGWQGYVPPKRRRIGPMLAKLQEQAQGTGTVQQAVGKLYVCPPCGLDCDKLTFDKPGVCPHCGMSLIEKTQQKPVSVAILLFNGVQIIDYSGPWEVFGQAGFEVHTVAEKSGPIRTAFGQRVLPEFTFENCPKADILLIPGGGVSGALNNAKVIEWIQKSAQDSKHVMSVCTGAFLLAKAGLLDGLKATTFHQSIAGLAKAAPKATVVYDERYVDNGKVITTAGLSSGIDGALHLVAKILGKGQAQATALGLEYRWEPDSKYARAALADRYLPRLRDAKTLSTEGDRDHWQKEVLVSGSGSAAEVIELMGRQITSSPPGSSTKLLPPVSSPDKAEIEWRFTDDRGRTWRGAGVAVPSANDKGKCLVTMKVAREVN